MARLSRPGKLKNINLGAFLKEEDAALAFDHEARKHGRRGAQLNFSHVGTFWLRN